MARDLFRYRWLGRFRRWAGLNASGRDDFDWDIYTHHYKAELAEIQKVHTLRLSAGEYVFSDGKLERNRPILPLHPNHRLLYETILQLQPQSVMEIGCGGGDHLHNLSVLSERFLLYGCDRSTAQLAFLKKRSPALKATTLPLDITNVAAEPLPIVDLCYTQAVIMHIQTPDAHTAALANLFRLATKQVVLMENWSRHDFLGTIQQLHERKLIAWPRLWFYQRISPELNRPHLMIVSSRELKYEPLTDYGDLLRGFSED